MFILLQFDQLPNPQSVYSIHHIKLLKMAPREGNDPPTFRVTTECSTSWAILELKIKFESVDSLTTT